MVAKHQPRYREFLWSTFATLTVLGITCGCMTRWYDATIWLRQHVWNVGYWHDLGYMLPCLVLTGFILATEFYCKIVSPRDAH